MSKILQLMLLLVRARVGRLFHCQVWTLGGEFLCKLIWSQLLLMVFHARIWRNENFKVLRSSVLWDFSTNGMYLIILYFWSSLGPSCMFG